MWTTHVRQHGCLSAHVFPNSSGARPSKICMTFFWPSGQICQRCQKYVYIWKVASGSRTEIKNSLFCKVLDILTFSSVTNGCFSNVNIPLTSLTAWSRKGHTDFWNSWAVDGKVRFSVIFKHRCLVTLTTTTRNVNFPSEVNPRKYYWKLQSVSMKEILSLWISRRKPCGWGLLLMVSWISFVGNRCGKPSEGFLAEKLYKPLDSWSLSLTGNSTFLVRFAQIIHSNRLNHELYSEPSFPAPQLYLLSHTLRTKFVLRIF